MRLYTESHNILSSAKRRSLRIDVIDTQSLDFNIAKSVWYHMKRQKIKRRSKLKKKKNVVLEVWNNLPAKCFKKQCASITRRLMTF